MIWITGLSGAGKSTLARALMPDLPGAVLLDGDELRAVLGEGASGFDRQSRLRLAMIYARLCKLLADQGLTVVIATISLFHEVHAWNRTHLPGYLEIWLESPEEVRRARDPKGLYAAAARGQAAQMAGQDTPVDVPLAPASDAEYRALSPAQCLGGAVNAPPRQINVHTAACRISCGPRPALLPSCPLASACG